MSSQDGKTIIVFDSHDPIASATWNKSFDELRENGWIDEKGNLLPSHDAATVQWGGDVALDVDQGLIWFKVSSALGAGENQRVCKIVFAPPY